MITNTLTNIISSCTLIFAASYLNADIYDPHTSFLSATLAGGKNELVDPKNKSAKDFEKEYFKNIVTDVYDYAGSAIGNLTLGEWRTANGFDIAEDISNLKKDLYKGTDELRRIDIALKKISADYYNSADLGLGRRMTCIKQTTDKDENAITDPIEKKLRERGLHAIACYVSNYGSIGGNVADGFNSFPANGKVQATLASEPQAFATVAMEFWPNAPENKVRFFVFAEAGNPGVNDDKLAYFESGNDPAKFTAIKLDNGTGHSQPGICASCHGGSVKADNLGIVNDAHFLPFDVFSFEFADTFGRSATGEVSDIRVKAKQNFDVMNSWIFKAEASAYQDNNSKKVTSKVAKYIEGSYDIEMAFRDGSGRITEFESDAFLFEKFISRNSKFRMNENYIPLEFDGNKLDRELYKRVTAPYCRGCHLALKTKLNPVFTRGFACTDAERLKMPHAEVNTRNFQRHIDVLRPFLGSQCNSIASLVDFEQEESPGAIYNTPALLGNALTLSETATKGQLTKNVTKRIAGLPETSNSGLVILSHESGLSNTNRILDLNFHYLLTDGVDDSIEVIFAIPESPFSKVLKITSETYTVDGVTTANGDDSVVGLHVQGNNDLELYKIARLKDHIPANAFWAAIRLNRPNNQSPVEIDDITVQLTSEYKTIAGVDFESGDERLYIDTRMKQASCNTDLFDVTQDRKVIRDAGRFSLGIPANGCKSATYNTIVRLTPGYKIDPSATYIVSFDYSVSEGGELSAAVNNDSSVFGLGNALSNPIGVQAASERKPSGRFVYRVPASVIANGHLGMTFRYVVTDENHEGVAIDNIILYEKK